MNIREVFTASVTELNRAPNTISAYLNGYNEFLRFLEEVRGLHADDDAKLINPSDFIEFPGWLQKQRPFAKSTLGVYLSGVTQLYEWMAIKDFIDPTPREQIKFEKAKSTQLSIHEHTLPINRLPSDEDIKKVRIAVRQRKIKSPRYERDIALIEFMISSGCRNGEVATLLVKDFDLEKGIVKIYDAKGGADGIAYLWPEVSELILKYWKRRGWDGNINDPAFARHDRRVSNEHDFMTPTAIRNVVNDVGKIAGIKLSPHWFRHYAATKMLETTGDIAAVQKFLRHANIGTTRRYAETLDKGLQDQHSKARY